MMQAWADYLDQLRAGEEIEPGGLRAGTRSRSKGSR